MIMMRFSDRMKIQELFEAWCVKNEEQFHHGERIDRCMNNMIAFLEHRGWLNVDRVVKDLKDERKGLLAKTNLRSMPTTQVPKVLEVRKNVK